eukprot:3340675-Karenia_brevis.AAC.1
MMMRMMMVVVMMMMMMMIAREFIVLSIGFCPLWVGQCDDDDDDDDDDDGDVDDDNLRHCSCWATHCRTWTVQEAITTLAEKAKLKQAGAP